jgi:hypothetical protein
MIIRATPTIDNADKEIFVEIGFSDEIDIHDIAIELRKLLYGLGYHHESIMEILPEE